LEHHVVKLLLYLRAARIAIPVVHLGRIVDEIVELAGPRTEVEGALVRARAHGPQLQADAAARRMHVPFAVRGVARLGSTAEQLTETFSLHRERRGNSRQLVESRREVEGG